jgi:hypothetical protein
MKRPYQWQFRARFRTNAFSWRGTALASKRLKEAVAEIKKASKSDPVAAGDGCVVLMERLWPALQSIDSSSGALGNTVNRTLHALIPILIAAPCDRELRAKWLERLYQAVCDDGVQYLTPVEERWGELCVFPELANEWADRMLPRLREVWAARRPGDHVRGDTLCLSCLLETGRYKELGGVLSLRRMRFWPNDKFMAEAMAREGRIDEAVAYAEAHHDEHYERPEIIAFCERILLEAGRTEEAYRRFGLFAVNATTNLSVFRKTAAQYPEKDQRQVLLDLIEARGNKGKWFAASKDAGFLDIALECAQTGDTEPKTLIRAARDFEETEPEFAVDVALCAIQILLCGGGYEPSTSDIQSACDYLMAAARRLGRAEWARTALQQMLAAPEEHLDDHMKKAIEIRLRRDLS